MRPETIVAATSRRPRASDTEGRRLPRPPPAPPSRGRCPASCEVITGGQRRVDRQALQPPKARHRRSLRADIAASQHAELLHVLPRAEQLEHARKHEIEGYARDPSQNAVRSNRRGGLSLASLNHVLDVRALLDGVLERSATRTAG